MTDFVIGVGAAAGTTQTGTSQTCGSPQRSCRDGVGVEIPAGNGQGYWAGLTLQFKNKATNQDACKNSTVTITYTAA